MKARLGRWLVPYLFHALALGGAGIWLVSLLTGHDLPWGAQVTAVACLAVWIITHALMTGCYRSAVRTGETWRRLWQAEQQKKRSWLS